ncbi:hypothetical protein phiK7A1_049c [Pseudomonas phage phiK7A1]|uniref:Uncharacterized protein n=1 Tax=Pseudomonas phage phiK7A1 TaxID=2759194 RepID=A0A7H0XFP9_9CAUD|nr:hypothetical protein phiK7A1_049c [Pseudomonas phage phiK7A1]
MKLTAKNKELVAQITNGFITTPIIAVLAEDGHELTPELLAGINHAVSMMDTSVLQGVVGTALAERIDFKALAKVNKFLAEPSTQDVLVAVQQVSAEVQELVNDAARSVLTLAATPVDAE